MNRSLGVCTWTFGPTPLETIAATLSGLGYDGVELHGDLDAFRPASARKILGNEGLRVFSLTPANVDIASPDAAEREAAISYYRRLIDFAAEIGGALVSVHGKVGRIAPVTTMEEERALLADAAAGLAGHARDAGVDLVFEVLNRYESHLVNTASEALRLLAEIGSPNFRVLLDAYHMNIEEADPAEAIRTSGERLGLFHVADSNRDAVGAGHTDFSTIFGALDEIGYRGPVIVECTPPGPNPFTPTKGADSVAVLTEQLRRCRAALRADQG